jgi:hypothetical protein
MRENQEHFVFRDESLGKMLEVWSVNKKKLLECIQIKVLLCK